MDALNNYYFKIKQFCIDKRNQPLVDVFLFMVITYGFHKIWRFFVMDIMSIELISSMSDTLAYWVFIWSVWFNEHILGFNFTIKDPNTFLFENGYIAVNQSCSGLKQMYQVLFLFVLFPGPWKHKLWYIPFSFFIMFLTNVFRIVSLSWILHVFPEHWHFSHDWILRPFFYVVLFGLWILWVEKFRNKKQKAIKVSEILNTENQIGMGEDGKHQI